MRSFFLVLAKDVLRYSVIASYDGHIINENGCFMRFKKINCKRLIITLLSALNSGSILAASLATNLTSYVQTLKQGHAVIQLGSFWSTQGSAQHINIEGLIGDDFTVSHSKQSNGLIGLGYFLDGQDKNVFNLSYGINAFYLAKTAVTGNVIQEGLFTNLSYGYDVTHFPVYAAAKATIKTKSPRYAITVDAGIGPNFMRTTGFQEYSLDGVTLPDNIFSSHTTTTFSAMAGVGAKLNNAFGKIPLECGYRFFYLGQGHFNKTSNQVVNALNTGTTYANAVMCAITFQ